MLWALFAILHSLFRAAFAETNRLFLRDGWQMNFWHAVFGMVWLFPFILQVNWPYDSAFYLGSFLVACVVTGGALFQLLMGARQRARVSGMHLPLETLFAFLFWVAVMPGSIELYADDALSTAGLVAGYGLAAMALLRIRPNDAGWRSFLAVIPGAAALGAAGVMIKLLLSERDLSDAVFAFVFVNYAIMTLVMGMALFVKRKLGHGFMESAVIRGGALLGLFSAGSFIFLVFSISQAFSPAYPVVLTMLVPAWVLAWHKMTGKPDSSRPWPMVLLFAGVALVVACSV